MDEHLDELFLKALAEDLGKGDLTSTLIPSSMDGRADVVFKESGVVCGLLVAERIFRLIDEDLRFLPACQDGDVIEPGKALFFVEGKTRSILTAERTALNFLSRMSGIATKTRAFVQAVDGTSTKIYDTRKTTPLHRAFERYAVKMGGGVNHRQGLFDEVLIKDNHLKALNQMPIPRILEIASSRFMKKIHIGIEVKDLVELESALLSPCDYILLDNFSVEKVREAVELRKKIHKHTPLEVSGGVRLENVREYAECGVERISVGCLTHTVRSVDVSLNLI